jgi:hypothetical protein
MSIADEFLSSTGQTCPSGMTCEPSHQRLLNGPTHGVDVPSDHSAQTCGETLQPSVTRLTLLPVEIPAKPTALQPGPRLRERRVSAVSSSALLMSFARALFSERIQATSAGMLPGLGGDSGTSLNDLAMWCCPSDSEPVALALTIDGTGCSCSVNMPTPCASEWKGGTAKPNAKSNRKLLRHHWARQTGNPYVPCQVLEAVQGFPITWSELRD